MDKSFRIVIKIKNEYMKIIEKKTTVTKYVAFDGTEFDCPNECKNYEGSQFGILMASLENATIKKMNKLGSDTMDYWYNAYYVIVPRTRHDIFVLDQILNIAGVTETEHITGNDCYQVIILAVSLCCNVLGNAHVIRPNELIKDWTNGQFEVISNIKDIKKDEITDKIAEK